MFHTHPAVERQRSVEAAVRPTCGVDPAAKAETVQEPVASAGLGPLPEPAQPAEPEGYMPGCLWPLPATPDYYTAAQMREYALRALAESVQESVQQALCEADRIMGHDDESTEWRERWAHLFSCALTNGGYQCSCGANQRNAK